MDAQREEEEEGDEEDTELLIGHLEEESRSFHSWRTTAALRPTFPVRDVSGGARLTPPCSPL